MARTLTAQPYQLMLSVFMGGAATLAAEMAASRLLGAYFGVSNTVWINIIGLILIYLAAGYFIGGRWADQTPYPRVFYTLVAWSSFWVGLAPFAARLVLPAVASLNWPLGIATAFSILLLLTIPTILLGCISPFAIRLAIVDINQTGHIAGKIYAISTLGSVLGSLLPVLYLLPAAGTTATFMYFSYGLFLVALIGLLSVNPQRILYVVWIPVLLSMIWVLSG